MASSPTSAAQACASANHGLRMTEDEYLALPEDKPYLEYIDGWVLQKPIVDANHSDLAVEIVAALREYGKRVGGRAGIERRAYFAASHKYRLPDVCFFAAGRPAPNDALPTLAVEIRLPGQTVAELQAKCRFIRANGVDVCWLVDPRLRTIEVFEGDETAILNAEQNLTCATLPGFELKLPDLFAVLDSPR